VLNTKKAVAVPATD